MLLSGNLLIAVSCVIVLSILIEGAQAFLPASFSRGYACGDLWASLVGGLLGSLIAMGFLAVRAMRHINKSEKSKY
jgi:VanZ family protein